MRPIDLWCSCMIQLNWKWKPCGDLYWPQRRKDLTGRPPSWTPLSFPFCHIGFTIHIETHGSMSVCNSSGKLNCTVRAWIIWLVSCSCFWHCWGRGSMQIRQHHSVYPTTYDHFNQLEQKRFLAYLGYPSPYKWKCTIACMVCTVQYLVHEGKS